MSEATQNDLVAIQEIGARLTGRKRDRSLSGGSRLEETAAAVRRVGRDGASAEEIAGIEIDTANGVMRDKLGDGPVEVAHVGARHQMRRHGTFAHCRGGQKKLERDVEG